MAQAVVINIEALDTYGGDDENMSKLDRVKLLCWFSDEPDLIKSLKLINENKCIASAENSIRIDPLFNWMSENQLSNYIKVIRELAHRVVPLFNERFRWLSRMFTAFIKTADSKSRKLRIEIVPG